MAETHQEVVKVWIAPGCIVCDACETECPDVFDVQEETCVIRPAAQSADFTKPLTPAVIAAAEACPVEVIKFDMIEVDGPEPWAGQEEQTAEAGASKGGGDAGKKAPTIPQGPPDPKWATLLASAHTSRRLSAGEEGAVQPATVPVDAVGAALGKDAPADAQESLLVASGYTRPSPTVAQRILERAGVLTSAAEMTRREFNVALTVAWGSLAAVAATFGAALQDYMVPKVTKEPPTTFRAGRISEFSEQKVYEQYKGSQGVWLVREPNGKLVALSTICTHLGCIPNWLPADQKFKCPCHGSGFHMSGVNFEGPAPRPLERYKISLEGQFVVIDKSKKFRQELGQWDDPSAFVDA